MVTIKGADKLVDAKKMLEKLRGTLLLQSPVKGFHFTNRTGESPIADEKVTELDEEDATLTLTLSHGKSKMIRLCTGEDYDQETVLFVTEPTLVKREGCVRLSVCCCDTNI